MNKKEFLDNRANLEKVLKEINKKPLTEYEAKLMKSSIYLFYCLSEYDYGWPANNAGLDCEIKALMMSAKEVLDEMLKNDCGPIETPLIIV